MKKPVKLSPQETRALEMLKANRGINVPVDRLYRAVKGKATKKIPHRAMQRHVGMVIFRLNQKQVKFSIKPSEPRTYILRRR